MYDSKIFHERGTESQLKHGDGATLAGCETRAGGSSGP